MSNISEMIKDMATATVDYYAIYRFVLFSMTLSELSRARHCSTLNNLKTVQNIAILTMAESRT